MRLYDEIFKNAEGVALTKCIFIPNGGGYFEGVKGVEEFSKARIIVRFPKDFVAVDGENLSIRKYAQGDLQIDGNIFGVWLLGKDSSKEQKENSDVPVLL